MKDDGKHRKDKRQPGTTEHTEDTDLFFKFFRVFSVFRADDQGCLICKNRRSLGKHLKIVVRLNNERQTLLAENKAA